MSKKRLFILISLCMFFGFKSIVSAAPYFDNVGYYTEKNQRFEPNYVVQYGAQVYDDDHDIVSVTSTRLDTYETVPLGTIWNFSGQLMWNTEPIFNEDFLPKQLMFTALNSNGESSTVYTHILDRPQQIPFVENLSIGDFSLIPTISWNQISEAENYYIRLYESNTVIWRSPSIHGSYFTLPSGILSADKKYTVRLLANDLDFENGIYVTENRSSTYASFQTSPLSSGAYITNASVWLEKRRFDPNYWAMDDQSFIFAWAQANYQESAANGRDNPVVLDSTPTGTVTMGYEGFWTPTDEGFGYQFDYGSDIASMETSYEFSIDSASGSAVTRVINPGSYNPLFEFVVPTVQGTSLSWSAIDGADGYKVRFWNLTQEGAIDTSTILYSSKFFNGTQFNIPEDYYVGEYAVSIEAIDLLGGSKINRTRYYTQLRRARTHYDFDYDGDGDIAWLKTTNNSLISWVMQNGSLTSKRWLGFGWTGYSLLGPADLDSDGDSDLVWWNPTDNNVKAWLIQSGNVSVKKWLDYGWPGYKLAAAGDLDGDGDDDLVWFDPDSFATKAWLMQNSSIAQKKWMGYTWSGYRLEDMVDLDGDGDDDFVWFNPSTRATKAWKMPNGGRVWLGYAQAGTKLLASGDFDGDGDEDVMWHDTATRKTYTWEMKWGAPVKTHWVAFSEPNFLFHQVADIDADGIMEVIWTNPTNGNTKAWHMSGCRVGQVAWLGFNK